MGVLDGQAVNAAVTNPAFINKNVNDSMPNQLGFTRPLSGPNIADIQQAVNNIYTASGVSETASGTLYGATPGTVTNGQNYQTAIAVLANKFDATTGHLHSGSSGDGPLLHVVRTLAVTGGIGQFGDITLVAGTNMIIDSPTAGIFRFAASGGPAVTIAVSGSSPLTGPVVLQAGNGMSLTQTGQNILFAASGNAFTLAASGQSQLTGNVLLQAGNNISLLQSGQNIMISASGSTGISPTITRYLSGSGTYFPPVGCQYIEVEMIGGGSGGGGCGTNSSTSGAGGNTTFGTSLLTATGGTGVAFAGAGAGGTATVNSPAIAIVALSGANGGTGINQPATNSLEMPAGMGASSPFGGAGCSSFNGGTGGNAVANTGSGGGGGNTSNNIATASAAGGAAGGYIRALITSPSAGGYAYSVGGGGAGGVGTGGSATTGGIGGSGIIIIREYYAPVVINTGSGGAITPTVQVFTSNGTYTAPSGLSYARVKVIGSGGGGGGASNNAANAGGGGGGGGGTSISLLTAAQIGASQTVTIGAAGTAGTSSPTAGGTGGTSSFGSLVVATGGAGGGAGTANGICGIGGAGGNVSGSTGQEIGTGGGGVSGGPGIPSVAAGNGGAGGSSSFGGGGKGTSNSSSANAGTNYGGGGSGAAANQTAGAGATGIVIVEEFYNNGAIGTATTLTGNLAGSQVTGPLQSSIVQGTTAGGNATAGYIGELISANSGAVSPVTTNVYVTIASISLTAGDWDVEGQGQMITGSTTAATGYSVGISLNPTSVDTAANGGYNQAFYSLAVSQSYVFPTGKRRINVSTTTTVYLIGYLTFTVLAGAQWQIASIIQARRVR